VKKTYIFTFLLFLSLNQFAQRGFSPDPLVDVIHYEFNITLNDSSDMITGITVTDVKFRGTVPLLVFDMKNINKDGKGMIINAVEYDDKKIAWEHTGNKLKIIPSGVTDSGSECRITVHYSGIPADGLIISRNKFGDRTFFADHWPDRASCYLPVVDHPSDKAKVDFIITAPSHYEVVANGYLTEESDLPGGYRLTHWKEDIPVPVKVMTFGVASFAVQLAGTVDNIAVWTWVFPENRIAGFNDYSVAVKPIALYNKLIGPYSYEKLANVQSKTIFGGLENAGCIFYSENSVTGQGRAERLIAHEIAHQWFGNSVTENNWHHIWLSEGFATYLASVYMEMTYGREKLENDMKSARDRVIAAYKRNPTPVIDTAITNLMLLLGANSYQKGAWVLHMLRNELGDENFWKGMQLYYERYRNGNAMTDDLRKVMEEISRKDLSAFFHQWLYIAGQPDLRIRTEHGNRKDRIDIVIEQTQDYLFSFSIDIMLKDKDGGRTITIPVDQKITRIIVKAAPDAELTADPHVKLLFREIQN
jgi:aminopeptidase N